MADCPIFCLYIPYIELTLITTPPKAPCGSLGGVLRYKISMIEKREILHKKEVKKLQKQNTDTVSSLQSQYNTLSKEYHSLESTTATRIERLEREKSDLLARLRAMLYKLNEKLKETIKAFMEFPRRNCGCSALDTVIRSWSTLPTVPMSETWLTPRRCLNVHFLTTDSSTKAAMSCIA